MILQAYRFSVRQKAAAKIKLGPNVSQTITLTPRTTGNRSRKYAKRIRNQVQSSEKKEDRASMAGYSLLDQTEQCKCA